MSLAILQKLLKSKLMRFFKIINERKFTLISIFLFTYVILNLVDGDRGLLSFYDKKHTIEKLTKEKRSLQIKLDLIEKKNKLLTEKIDIDYLETLYRQKFMFGKKSERIYIK